MEKEFVPYNIALILKDLGFNEICFGEYSLTGLFEIKPNTSHWCAVCNAPLYQQVFNWLDTKHKIRIDLCHADSNGTYTFKIWTFHEPNNVGKWKRYSFIVSYDNYIDRNNAAILEAIKLIQ